MIKLIYACADKNTKLNIISIYSNDEQSVVEFIDSNLLGIDIEFIDIEGGILGKVSKDDYTCSEEIEGYHEPEDDLMMDILDGDPEFDNINIYSMMVNLDKAKSEEIIAKLDSIAKSFGIKFIKD